MFSNWLGDKEKTKIDINEDESETMEKEEYFLRKRRNISVTITKFSLEVLLLQTDFEGNPNNVDTLPVFLALLKNIVLGNPKIDPRMKHWPDSAVLDSASICFGNFLDSVCVKLFSSTNIN